MITWAILLLILTIGIGLIIIEIIFVPGTTVIGVLGLICVIAGILYGFSEFGSPTGWVIAAAAAIISIAVIIVGLKSGMWKRFALNQTIDSKVNDHVLIEVKVGDEGVAMSALRPVGNAEFGDDKLEVTTLGELVDSDSKVKVTHIEGRVIYVKQLNN